MAFLLLIAAPTSPSSLPRQQEDKKFLLFISSFLPPAGMCRGPFVVCLSALFFPNSHVSATVAVCLLDRVLQPGRPSSGDKENKKHILSYNLSDFFFFFFWDNGRGIHCMDTRLLRSEEMDWWICSTYLNAENSPEKTNKRQIKYQAGGTAQSHITDESAPQVGDSEPDSRRKAQSQPTDFACGDASDCSKWLPLLNGIPEGAYSP